MHLFGRKRRSVRRHGDLPETFDADGRLRVACWYCGDEVRHEGFDPCAVVLITNWDDEAKAREQQFFAHVECFRKSGSGTDLYILEDDFDEQ